MALVPSNEVTDLRYFGKPEALKNPGTAFQGTNLDYEVVRTSLQVFRFKLVRNFLLDSRIYVRVNVSEL